MSRYLLSSQALLDICRRQGKPAEKWLEAVTAAGTDASDVCISAVVPMNLFGLIQMEIAKAKTDRAASRKLPAWRDLEANVRSYVLDLAADDRIVPMDHHIALCWGILLDSEILYVDAGGRPYPIGSAEKLEIATAIVGRQGIPFVYVADQQAAHADIPHLLVESP